MQLKLQLYQKDKFLWWVLYPTIALSFIFIANDNPLRLLVQIPSFKTDLVFAFITTFGIGFYLNWLNKKLNAAHLSINIKRRLQVQLLFGLCLPLTVAMGLEILYLKLIEVPIQESSIFNLELPLAFLFLLLINLYYLSQFLYHQSFHTRSSNVEVKSTALKHIIVQTGAIEEKITLNQCAYLKSEHKVVWLYTFNHKCHRLSGSLEEWEAKLKGNYFKINRQFIVAHAAIQSIEIAPTRKIRVYFQQLVEEEVYVSKANAARFKIWWKTERPLG